jgi:protein-tyrosine phosphatase
LIDLHCHILPFVDDGPQSFVECFEMANQAVEGGITHLFATPHHRNGRFSNFKSTILDRVVNLNKLLKQEDIPLTVHSGQELRIHREIFNSLAQDEVLTLDNKDKYLLLELPPDEVPSYTAEIIYELLLKNLTPIIVHPERNARLLHENNLLFELVREGALIQLTSGSIIGQFGKKVKSFAEKIIEHNLAHFIATDAHNVGTRGFCLLEAYETITRIYGSKQTFYFRENAELLLSGQHPYIYEPIPFRKKLAFWEKKNHIGSE